MKFELSKTIVSVATAAFLALASWALYSITELKTESEMCKYQNNIYNGLFQELFEKHSEDRSFFLSTMHRKTMSAAPKKESRTDSFAEILPKQPKEK